MDEQIPQVQKASWDEVREDAYQAIIYTEENEKAVKKTAAAMGKAGRTVYDYLYDRLGKEFTTQLLFLRSAIEGTNGDPRLIKYVETPSFRLVPRAKCDPDKSTLAEECVDDLPALAEYHRVLRDPDSTDDEIDRAEAAVIKELAENKERRRMERGKSS